mmetsp:Transcript_27761/g.62500  ORF Transcript_27761/g.62500 Transcript_27761/m.62500 type:complete len:193 (-) Transcript_27761:99-677(-)
MGLARKSFSEPLMRARLRRCGLGRTGVLGAALCAFAWGFDAFIGSEVGPDLSGEKRQEAARRVAEAKLALDEALDLRAAGASSGLWYQVVTDGEDGIGIREEPDLQADRVEDLVRGTVFEVDDVVQEAGEPIFLHLKDGRGWVFDLSPVDPETPTVKRLQGIYVNGKTIEELELEVKEARVELDRIRGARKT